MPEVLTAGLLLSVFMAVPSIVKVETLVAVMQPEPEQVAMRLFSFPVAR